MQTVLDVWARRFGFSYGVQLTSQVAQGLDTDGDAFAAPLLTSPEFAQFKKHRIRKRRVEWLAGRIAAKEAFSHYQKASGNGYSVTSISVLNGTDRAPYIPEYPNVRISLTHSHEYAIAVIADFPVGIDLEKVERRPSALAEYFFSPKERMMLEASCLGSDHQHEFMTRVWSRKEALVKLWGVGSSFDFKVVDTSSDRVSVHGRNARSLLLLSESWGGYLVSVALDSGSAAACECD